MRCRCVASRVRGYETPIAATNSQEATTATESWGIRQVSLERQTLSVVPGGWSRGNVVDARVLESGTGEVEAVSKEILRTLALALLRCGEKYWRWQKGRSEATSCRLAGYKECEAASSAWTIQSLPPVPRTTRSSKHFCCCCSCFFVCYRASSTTLLTRARVTKSNSAFLFFSHLTSKRALVMPPANFIQHSAS